MSSLRAFIPFVLAAMAALQAGCAAPPTAGPGVPDLQADPLADVGRWTLQGATGPDGRRDAALHPNGRPVHAIAFEAGSLTVNGGCNRMTGTYRYAANGDLLVGPLASTRMACADHGLMAADTALATMLEGSARWSIAESWPEQLSLQHHDGSASSWVADRGGD